MRINIETTTKAATKYNAKDSANLKIILTLKYSNGVYDFVYLLAFISISLGLTNFLPIPALDGGRMVLLVVEGIRRKPLDEKVEDAIQSFGFLLLIALAIFVSANDLIRLVKTLI